MPAGEESEIPLEEVSAPATIAARQPSAIVADVRLREGWLATITNKPVLARREFHRARSIGYSDTTAPALLANRVLTNQPLPDLPESLAVSSTPLNGRAGLNAALQPRPPKGTGANEPTLLGVNIRAAPIAFFFALDFFGSPARVVFDLAQLGGLKRLHPAFHFRIGNTGGPFGRVAIGGRAATGRGGGRTRLRHDNALALRLNDDRLRAPVAEALLHLPGTSGAKAEWFFAVSIAHASL